MATAIERFQSTPKGKQLMQQERLILEVTEFIIAKMQEKGVTRSELARRLEKSKGWISQLLAGEANFTLRTLADVFGALGHCPTIGTKCDDERTPAHDISSAFGAAPVMWRQFQWSTCRSQTSDTQLQDELLAG